MHRKARAFFEAEDLITTKDLVKEGLSPCEILRVLRKENIVYRGFLTTGFGGAG